MPCARKSSRRPSTIIETTASFNTRLCFSPELTIDPLQICTLIDYIYMEHIVKKINLFRVRGVLASLAVAVTLNGLEAFVDGGNVELRATETKGLEEVLKGGRKLIRRLLSQETALVAELNY